MVLYGDGTQSRDFTYVDDIARGTIAGLRPVGYDIINLGSDQPITMNQALQTIERAVGRPAQVVQYPPHPADMAATWADVSKAGQVLGWEPQHNFEQGIQQTVQWYQTQRDWAKEISTE